MTTGPQHDHYDVVIVGGAMIGASVAFWTMRNPDFQGRILVVEQDPTYARAATSLTNSCIRQQFGTEVNIRLSQFGADFIADFAGYMDDATAPALSIQSFGYLYLAADPAFAAVLADNQILQSRLGAGTTILTPDQIAARWPFYTVDDIVAGSHNPLNEGYFDGGTIFDRVRRKGRDLGVEYLHDRVTGLDLDGDKVTAVSLASGRRVGCDIVVNCAGTRAAAVAAMAGLSLPVEARRRYTFVFDCATPLGQDLPLTIDPSGIHVRTDGTGYMAGGYADAEEDAPADPDDFAVDHTLFEDKFWPLLAHRVPAFERIRLRNTWVGHYDTNLLDQNAILGPHPEIGNFLFANGFSGHGLQQSQGVGRGLSEQIIYGAWRSLDLSDLSYARVAANRPLRERAII